MPLSPIVCLLVFLASWLGFSHLASRRQLGSIVSIGGSFVAASLVLCLVLLMTTDKKDAGAKPPTSASSDSPSSPERKFITGAQWFGATSKEVFDKLVEYLVVHEDEEAFAKLMTAGKLTGETTKFMKGEEVFIADTALFSGLIKLRRKGDTREYWTNTEAAR